MSPIIPSRYGHPKYNIIPQKSRATSLGGVKGSSQRGTPGSDSKSRRRQRQEENKITVQPTEDEEADNFYSKQLAAARFQRNHRLINILFNEVVVDQDQTIEIQATRAKRIKSLEDYKDKIDKEILDLSEKFNVKRAKMIEDGKKFNEQLSEFIIRSKKEIETLKAAQEVRRQKEALIRQQAPKIIPVPVEAQSNTPLTTGSPTTQNKLGEPKASDVLMDIEPKPDFIDSKDVQNVLEGIINSVSEAI